MEHNDIIVVDIRGLALGILLHRTQSAQKNITVKAYALISLLSHLNRIKQQQKRKLTKHGVKVLNSTVQRPQEVISMASTIQSLPSSGFSPAVHPRYLLSKTVLKEVKT